MVNRLFKVPVGPKAVHPARLRHRRHDVPLGGFDRSGFQVNRRWTCRRPTELRLLWRFRHTWRRPARRPALPPRRPPTRWWRAGSASCDAWPPSWPSSVVRCALSGGSAVWCAGGWLLIVHRHAPASETLVMTTVVRSVGSLAGLGVAGPGCSNRHPPTKPGHPDGGPSILSRSGVRGRRECQARFGCPGPVRRDRRFQTS